MHALDGLRWGWLRLRFVGTAVALGSLAGCGGASYGPAAETTASGAEPQLVQAAPAEQEAVRTYPEDARTLESDLLGQLELAEGMDCGAAGDLAERICELSERICGIAARHPGWRDVQDQCEDGRGRCAAARERVATRCE